MDVTQTFDFLDERSLIRDPDIAARYGSDVTGRFSGTPSVVVRPRDPEEISRVLDTCNNEGIGVVPQGGNTGLVGGAIPIDAEIILSLERLRSIGEIDRASRTLVAQAGATLEEVQGAARPSGLEFPLDFAARGTATVGGMIATDAGGSLAMRHGTMRDRVVGLQVALADGTIIDHLDRPPKDSTGFDLARLVPGSEGTLGIVTAARLALVEESAHRTVAMVALDSIEDAVSLTARLRARVSTVEAVDFFLDTGLELVLGHAGLKPPFKDRHRAFLVVSCAGAVDPNDELAAALEGCREVADVLVAQSSQQRNELWSYRELHNAAINASGVPHKLDVGVSMRLVPALVSRIDTYLREHETDAAGIYHGHLADGNVHVNILGPSADDEAVDEAVLTIVADIGGSISAEHGIGQAKNRWLHLTRSPEEIAAMRAIKRALDPNGIMNPGKLLPPM